MIHSYYGIDKNGKRKNIGTCRPEVRNNFVAKLVNKAEACGWKQIIELDKERQPNKVTFDIIDSRTVYTEELEVL